MKRNTCCCQISLQHVGEARLNQALWANGHGSWSQLDVNQARRGKHAREILHTCAESQRLSMSGSPLHAFEARALQLLQHHLWRQNDQTDAWPDSGQFDLEK